MTEQNMLVFPVDDQYYAVSTHCVNRVVRVVDISPLPNEPDILGVINLQGKITPIINLRKKLGLENKEYELNDVLVIIENRDKTFGFIAPEVNFCHFQKEVFVPLNKMENNSNFVEEIIKDKIGVIRVLNVNKIAVEEFE